MTADAFGTAAWRPRPARDVEIEVVGGDVVLSAHDRPAEVHEGTASLIWQFADGSCSLHELAGDLASVLGGDPSVLLAEALSFCHRMAEVGWMAGGSPDVDGPPVASEEPQATDEPEAPPGSWLAPLDLAVGGRMHRVLVDEESLRGRLDRAFATLKASPSQGDIDSVITISVAKRPGRGPRLLPALSLNGRSLLTSRDLDRIVCFLNGRLDPDSREGELQLRSYLAVIKSSRAILLPAALLSPSTLTELALATAGASLVEQPELRLGLGDGMIRRAGARSPAELAHSWGPPGALSYRGPKVALAGIVFPTDEPLPPARLVVQLMNDLERPGRATSPTLRAVSGLASRLRQITPGRTIASVRTAILDELS